MYSGANSAWLHALKWTLHEQPASIMGWTLRAPLLSVTDWMTDGSAGGTWWRS